MTVQRLASRRLLRGAGVRAAAGRAPNGAAEPPPRLILDLEKLQAVPAERAGPLARYAATIQAQRGDYNGRVLSIRQDDLRTLAVIYDETPSQLTEQLISWGVLNAGRAAGAGLTRGLPQVPAAPCPICLVCAAHLSR